MGNGKTNWLRELGVPVLATVAGLLVGVVFILMAGKDPIAAYSALLRVVARPRDIGETLVSTIPLILTGLSVALAFRCGLFNIGGEGQYLVAQFVTAWVGFHLTAPAWMPGLVQEAYLPLVTMLAGMAAGAFWAAIVGFLKAYRGVHEVINTIMMNYIGWHLTHYLLMNTFRDPEGRAATPAINAVTVFEQGLIEGSRLHAGLWIALLAAAAIWFFLFKTPAGYEIRAVGLSSGAAEYAGISVKRNIVLAMALAGALAGLAGSVQTLGLSGKMYEPLTFAGYGFDGIAVALVGRNHPLGVILAAFLFGALSRGGPLMQAMAGVPKTVILIVQASVIFFVAAEGIWRYLRTRKAREVKAA